MSDPIEARVRDYYRSLQTEPPAGLEARAARRFDAVLVRRGVRSPWKPGVALGFAAVVVVVAALALRGFGPGPVATGSPSLPIAASPTPTASSSPTAMPSPSATPVWNLPSQPTSPTPSPSPTPTPTPSPSPTAGTGTFGRPFANPIGRNGYTVTLLADGRVLVVGGIGTGSGSPVGRLSIAQIWDPKTGKFTTTGSLNVPRCQHTATLLPNGDVLIVGGGDLMDGIDNLASAELYDPKTGRFTMTGSMSQGRAYHSATLLPNGKVLIAGGYGGGTEPVASAELYDPASGTFSATGSMAEARDRQTATLIGGKVLIAGGAGVASSALDTAELYDPSTGRFAPAEPMNVGRYGAAATTFTDLSHPGSAFVLIAGGRDASGNPLDTAEVYVPLQNSFGLTPMPMKAARGEPAAVFVVTGGYVLIVGGNDGAASAETLDTQQVEFRSLVNVGSGAGQTAILLRDCKILLSANGGTSWEVYTPAVTCHA